MDNTDGVGKQMEWARLPSLLCHSPERDAITDLKTFHLLLLKVPFGQSLKGTFKHKC
jgi:hypothetical protein